MNQVKLLRGFMKRIKELEALALFYKELCNTLKQFFKYIP